MKKPNKTESIKDKQKMDVCIDYSNKCEQFEEDISDMNTLWDADPNCEHVEEAQSGGGVKCIKCGGWFCY